MSNELDISALGPRLGRFEIHRLVAVSGDRGAVFLGVDATTSLNQKYAITVLDTRRMELAARDALFERWSTSASLTHPALVPPVDRGGRRGVLFVVTSWLEGVDLEQLVTQHQTSEGEPLSLRQVATIGAELGEVLGSIHETTDASGARMGLVHGRIAMTRVFMMRSGNLRLLGFPGTAASMALARAPMDVKAFGFLAPEQLRGELPDESTDVYSLALLVLAARLGRNPLERATLAETETAVLAGVQWEGMDVEPALRELLEKALSVKAADRPRSARWLAAKLTQIGAGAPLLPSDWRVLLEDDFPRTQSTAHAIDADGAALAKFLMAEIRAADGPLEFDSETEEATTPPGASKRPAPRRDHGTAAPRAVQVGNSSSLRNAAALAVVMLGTLLLGGSLVGMSSIESQARTVAPVVVVAPPPVAPPQAAILLDGVEAAMAKHDAGAVQILLAKVEKEGNLPADLEVRYATLKDDFAREMGIHRVELAMNVGDFDAASVEVNAVLAAHPTDVQALAMAHDIAGKRSTPASASIASVKAVAVADPSTSAAPATGNGKIAITSDPPGVIYVDGVPVGTSPVTDYVVAPGQHSIEVRLGGHDLATRSVTVAAAKTEVVAIKMVPKAGSAGTATGTLDIASNPPGVVYIDGSPVGTSPVAGQRLAVGKHTVEVRLGGHASEHRDVVVESDKSQTLSLTLQSK